MTANYLREVSNADKTKSLILIKDAQHYVTGSITSLILTDHDLAADQSDFRKPRFSVKYFTKMVTRTIDEPI